MYSLRNQRFSVDVATMQLPSTFISSAVTRLYISTIRASPACNTYLNITLLRYTGYTQKNGAVSISRHVGKLVVTQTEHQL